MKTGHAVKAEQRNRKRYRERWEGLVHQKGTGQRPKESPAKDLREKVIKKNIIENLYDLELTLITGGKAN